MKIENWKFKIENQKLKLEIENWKLKTLIFIQHNKKLTKPNLTPNFSNLERNNKGQATGHDKCNTNTNNINNGKSEISFITNCISNNIKNINNSAMKNTGNMKEIVNKNVDIESKTNKRKIYKWC